MMINPLFIGGIGGIEIVAILGVFVLLFGASKIPELANATGQSIGEFQKGRQEIEQELDSLQNGDDNHE